MPNVPRTPGFSKGDSDPLHPHQGPDIPDGGRKVTVFNLATGREDVFVGLSIKDALISASQQAKGNHQFLTYPKAEDVTFVEGRETISFGDFSALRRDFSALRVKRAPRQGPVLNHLQEGSPQAVGSLSALAGLRVESTTTEEPLSRGAKVEVTLKQARADLGALGYDLKTTQNSNWISGTVTHSETGQVVSGGNVFEPAFMARHKGYFDYKADHSVKKDGWRVII